MKLSTIRAIAPPLSRIVQKKRMRQNVMIILKMHELSLAFRRFSRAYFNSLSGKTMSHHCSFIHSFIHSFIPDIYIALLQETYSEALSVQLRSKRNVRICPTSEMCSTTDIMWWVYLE